MARNDLSFAKNFDFNIINRWGGYNSTNDKTNIAENIMVRGSQNIYKKLSGNLSVRPGQKRIGAVDTTLSSVSSSFVWNTSWGATYPMWISNSKLQVSIDDVWYTLLSSLTKTRYIFDKWWNNTLKQDFCLFVKGDHDIQYWAGGYAVISSTAATTITKTGTATWTEAFFLPATKSVVINGTTYQYTGGEGTTTLTGVTPNPTGEANGSVVLQAVVTHSNTPASTFTNDFIKVINNQLYVGSYTSRLCYISSNSDYTNYTVPSPRTAGSPELLTLDDTLNGIGVKSGNAALSLGTDKWAIISFEDITVGSTLTQKTTVDVKPVANLATAYAHEFIANQGDNIIYLAKDQQVREFGNFNDLFYNAYPSLSLEIATELSEENFTGGSLSCIGEFTYLTAPVSGKVYLHQVRHTVDANNQVVVERLWHSPFTWNATRINEIDGTIVSFSNSNPQVYEVWDTNQWYDDSPSDEHLPYSCVLALPYMSNNRRQGLQAFDKVFTEGYLSRGTLLNLQINYDYQGSNSTIDAVINNIERPARLFGSISTSLGDVPLGDTPLGDEIEDETVSSEMRNMSKFKNINSLALIDCFEFQPILYSSSTDSHWELLSLGTNSKTIEQDATFIINRLQT